MNLVKMINCEDKKVGAIIASKVVMLLVGFVLIVYLFVLLLYKPKVVYPVLKMIPSEVSSIVLSPIGSNRQNNNLVSVPLTITDSADISLICAALQKAKPFSPAHPSSLWECLLVINKKDGSYKCLVNSTKTDRNGVLIVFYSCGTWGWSIGDYRSDTLGSVLESIVHKSN